MTTIRPARLEEAQYLSALALESKVCWDYSEDFIDSCVEDLTINEQYITDNYVFVLEDQSNIIGFFSFKKEPERSWLDFLYLHPVYIGRGYGKIIWNNVVEKAKQLKIETFTIDSDPNAKPFYEKMGAVLIGETPSTAIEGRMLPLLKFEVN
ncbi:GNAT family N-acetyltransferase [Alkalihalobacillus sp. AL-G]|uniref:GNAT family N-acetyltransferase n=1 Tax=Alkalihalobacillus sp. AL-G TaxID=2926399 RepID=UPI00272CB7BB|nr:GNAT family N-acetyltransferase [Alkalihalobacillus sp. AL-G]WLD94705.1 GNAT family N-acetyltransferase [Alkalihalobacillus sp. AL-G]